MVIYCHSMVITERIQLYNTELMYHHGMAEITAVKCFVTLQWVETNPSNIRFFPTDICFYLTSWYYVSGLWISIYGCSRMLDGWFPPTRNIEPR